MRRFEMSLRLLYAFAFFRSLQLFGPVALAFYRDRAGLDYTRIFALESSFVFAVFLLEVPTGVIADRFGRKVSLAAGGLLGGAGIALFAATVSYPLFFAANLLCAAGLTCTSGADRALFYDTLLAHGRKEEGRHYLSRYEAFGTAGLLIGFPAGSLLAGAPWLTYTARLALCFALSGAFIALAGLLALFADEPVREKSEKHPIREGIEGVTLLFRNRPLRAAAANLIFVSAVSFFVFWFYQALTREAGLSIRVNGFVAAGFNALGMVLLLNVRRIEARFSLDRTLLLTAFVPGACFTALAFCTAVPAVSLPLVFLLAGTKLARGPLLSDLINRQIESRNRATVLSGVSMLERGVVGLLYYPVGMLADHSLSGVFGALGAMALIAAFLTRLPQSGEGSANG